MKMSKNMASVIRAYKKLNRQSIVECAAALDVSPTSLKDCIVGKGNPKWLYPDIAKHYNTSWKNVERSIRTVASLHGSFDRMCFVVWQCAPWTAGQPILPSFSSLLPIYEVKCLFTLDSALWRYDLPGRTAASYILPNFCFQFLIFLLFCLPVAWFCAYV